MPVSPSSPQPLSPTELPVPSTLPVMPLVKKRLRHHRIRWTILSVCAVALIVLVIGGWLAYRAISVINTKKIDGQKLSFIQQLTHIVTTGDQKLNGEADDRINILLLGYGGPGHDGPYLTDTMMVASFKPSTKQLALISIPRDLVVDIPGYDYRKINSVLSFGRDEKYPGGGEALTVKVVSDALDLPIQYYARVDFTGFKEVIDRLGGVTVTVDTAFRDVEYPDNAYGYSPISFKAGTQTMSGDTALKFARSRHGNNGEGSDFARAKRQQKIIVAMRDKLTSLGTLLNPVKISDILGSLGAHSQTNMEVWEMIRLFHLAGNVKPDDIINKVYDNSATGLLKAATGTGGAFILVPRDGTYDDMKFVAQNIFLLHQVALEQAHVLVVNATSFTSLAATKAKSLVDFGLDIIRSLSLTTTTSGQTVVINRTPGRYTATEQLLRLYGHAAGTMSISEWERQTHDTTIGAALLTPVTINTKSAGENSNTTTTAMPDLVLILGQDQPKPTTTSIGGVSSTNTNTKSTTNTNTKKTNTNAATTNTNSKTTNTNTKLLNTNITATNSSTP